MLRFRQSAKVEGTEIALEIGGGEKMVRVQR